MPERATQPVDEAAPGAGEPGAPGAARRRRSSAARPLRSLHRLLGTPGPGTRPGGQNAGALTGAQPADPREAEA